MRIEYDGLADIYDPWSAADPAAASTLHFYTDICCQAKGTIVELGVGNGRIAVEVAETCNKNVVGLDISDEMLARCRQKAKSRGVADLVELVNADFRAFCLGRRVALIIMPFRTFGHLLTRCDKLTALRQVYSHLVPGGRFVFDHYVFDENWARSHDGVPRLMCRSLDESTGRAEYVWDTYLYDFETRSMDCTITVEQVGVDGTVVLRRHHPLSFSWVEPDQVRRMLMEVGFEIEKLYGSFDRSPFDDKSKEQIWVVKRPSDGTAREKCASVFVEPV